jgi:hypothetical protein
VAFGVISGEDHSMVIEEVNVDGCRHWRWNPGMKLLTDYVWFEVSGRRGFLNITDTVEKLERFK